MTTDINTIYDEYAAMVHRRCFSLLRNESAALDAMQDVFVQVLLKRNNLDLSNPSSLLYRIATNICLNKIRDEKKHQNFSESDPQFAMILQIANAEDIEKNTILNNILSYVFKHNPDSTRTIAVLYYVDGLTQEEISQEIGLSISGVRKRLRKLSEQLKEIGGVNL